MSWPTDALRLSLLFGSLALGVGACAQHHLCSRDEQCNYRDDDCDGRVDEGIVDADGEYRSLDHCGGCGVSCVTEFPSAAVTECVVSPAGVVEGCRIADCPMGEHLSGDGACVPDVPVACLPCSDDTDCQLRHPDARCVAMLTTSRCAAPCGAGCEVGFECAGLDGEPTCFPIGGDCSCHAENRGSSMACVLEGPGGEVCAGHQVCTDLGFTSCTPALEERCNGVDEDCDGVYDEGFLVDGVYTHPLHCGRCGEPCAAPGPNMIARCSAAAGVARCEIDCDVGFVDVDGIPANGCECELRVSDGAPVGIDADGDCDGVVDDSDEFVFVTSTGSDRDPGTLARPMRSLVAAMSRAASLGRDVLVARGVYVGAVDMVSGVSVFGGYRPDFRDRDLEIFPVVIEHRGAGPTLACRQIRAVTRFEGFQVQGFDASAVGAGSTAVYLDRCTAAVTLRDVQVFAGVGAAGVRGRSAADHLAAEGITSLAELNGRDGLGGRSGSSGGVCRRVSGGRGGRMSCSTVEVSGGAGGVADCPALSCDQVRPCGNAGCTDFTVAGVCDLEAALAVASPNPPAGAGRGASPGAAGELTFNAPTNRGECFFCDDNPTLPRDGGDGGDGPAGADGLGGTGCSGIPVFDSTTGSLAAGAGGAGTDGANGSGGGGGSAGAGYAVIAGTEGDCQDQSGGSGGGGGSAGCGAPGAEGGTGGGSSVGIAIRLPSGSATGPSLDRVRVVTARGGDGGDGGTGANGGGGGSGGNGGRPGFWCARTGGRGGDGGSGGDGGGGGGGCGGASHGVYVVALGPSPAEYIASLAETTSLEMVGMAGRGGGGGYAPRASGTPGRAGDASAIALHP